MTPAQQDLDVHDNLVENIKHATSFPLLSLFLLFWIYLCEGDGAELAGFEIGVWVGLITERFAVRKRAAQMINSVIKT